MGNFKNSKPRVQFHWFLKTKSVLRKMCVQIKRGPAFQFIHLMFYYEKCMFKVRERLLFSLFIINQYSTPKMFLLRILYASSCFLVYLSNPIRFPLTNAFEFTMDVILRRAGNCSFLLLLLFLFMKFIASIQLLNDLLMRKYYAYLGYLIKKQPEMLIKLTVKYFSSILQSFFSL